MQKYHLRPGLVGLTMVWKNRLLNGLYILAIVCSLYIIGRLDNPVRSHMLLAISALLVYAAVGPRIIQVFPKNKNDVSPYSPCHAGYFVIKRIIDIVFSFVLLLLLTPVFAIICIAVRISGQGPVIYRRKAIGRNGKIFEMLKFRSMVADADQILLQKSELNTSIRNQHKLKEDPRIDQVGKWLRIYSLDELPQLLNVLAGNMSLIGPRPLHPDEAYDYGHAIELYMAVTPGMTGLWQVSGRWDLSFEERVKLDTRYLQERGLATDLKLLIRTIPAVLRRTGAY